MGNAADSPRDTRTRSPRWSTWLLAVMVAMQLLYAIELLFGPMPPDVSTLFQKFASNAIFYGAAALCLVKGQAVRADRAAWRLLALAMALWGTGGFYYAIVLWDREVVPIPSVADFFWIVFYLPAYAGLFKLMRNRASTSGRGVLLDALVAGLGVGGAAAAVAFQVVLANTERDTAAIVTNLAYPIGDLGLLALVAAAITVVGWRASGVWRWLAPAFVLFAVADSIYLVQTADGSYPGSFVDLGWPVAALLVGVAAWHPEARMRRAPYPRTTVVVPGIFGCVALALLAVDHVVRMNLLAVILATASIFVILVRLYLTVKDNRLMLEQSRRDATTDALTGLGNRRQLKEDLAAHVEELVPEQPLLLTLFDLDGFKHYNDTFGHLAGDQLLERLGGRLSELMAGRGTAYRMGGDEFCALWNLSDVGQASATTMEAVGALSEHGDAFSIGCSYGSVLLPNETTDITDALRTADRRMYVRKGIGRASAGQQSSDVLLSALAERDLELGVHRGGVADLATATATHLGMPEEEMQALTQTALLHDVGKVAIPDEILGKPGPLDESEWTFMQRHTIIGERIISAAPALAPVARLVRATHERVDGSGYPDGLAGDDIPLISRIVAVCDAYHAMTTKRAYRDAHDTHWAIAELRSCAGTQFDPEVVEAFVVALDTANEVRRSALADDGA